MHFHSELISFMFSPVVKADFLFDLGSEAVSQACHCLYVTPGRQLVEEEPEDFWHWVEVQGQHLLGEAGGLAHSLLFDQELDVGRQLGDAQGLEPIGFFEIVEGLETLLDVFLDQGLLETPRQQLDFHVGATGLRVWPI